MSRYKSPKKRNVLSLMDQFLIILSTADQLKPWALDSRSVESVTSRTTSRFIC